MRYLVMAILLAGCGASTEPRMFVDATAIVTRGEERPTGYIVLGAPNDGRIVIAIGQLASVGINTTARTLTISDVDNHMLCDVARDDVDVSLTDIGGGRFRADAKADCGVAWVEWFE